MSTTLSAQAGRTADRIAVVSAVLHLLVGGLGVWLAQRDDASTAYLLLAGFCALGLLATLLGRASVSAGRATWTSGLVVLGLSLVVLLVAVTAEGGLGVLACAIPLLFIDVLLFSNARTALSGP
jgi:drug/metabolite transporter superfamily protein YnfA